MFPESLTNVASVVLGSSGESGEGVGNFESIYSVISDSYTKVRLDTIIRSSSIISTLSSSPKNPFAQAICKGVL